MPFPVKPKTLTLWALLSLATSPHSCCKSTALWAKVSLIYVYKVFFCKLGPKDLPCPPLGTMAVAHSSVWTHPPILWAVDPKVAFAPCPLGSWILLLG